MKPSLILFHSFSDDEQVLIYNKRTHQLLAVVDLLHIPSLTTREWSLNTTAGWLETTFEGVSYSLPEFILGHRFSADWLLDFANGNSLDYTASNLSLVHSTFAQLKKNTGLGMPLGITQKGLDTFSFKLDVNNRKFEFGSLSKTYLANLVFTVFMDSKAATESLFNKYSTEPYLKVTPLPLQTERFRQLSNHLSEQIVETHPPAKL
jgi:hypothetical protein